MKNIVIFSGAGMSQESGLGTFRDSGGLWEKHNIEDVATPEAFHKDPKSVLNFYNIRRKELIKTKPNYAHFELNKLNDPFNVCIITQNIDDLHERSGSEKVIHLHGKLMEAKSTVDGKTYPLTTSELNIGDVCDKGSQLRPNVVWFGENVPNMQTAIEKTKNANIFIIIGTSLSVYPAASLINYATNAERIILIDPNAQEQDGVEIINQKATIAVPKLVNELLSQKTN